MGEAAPDVPEQAERPERQQKRRRKLGEAELLSNMPTQTVRSTANPQDEARRRLTEVVVRSTRDRNRRRATYSERGAARPNMAGRNHPTWRDVWTTLSPDERRRHGERFRVPRGRYVPVDDRSGQTWEDAFKQLKRAAAAARLQKEWKEWDPFKLECNNRKLLWLLAKTKYTSSTWRKLLGPAMRGERAKLRDQYRQYCAEKWKRVAALVRVQMMKMSLAQAHSKKHVERREFSVGFYLSLQSRRLAEWRGGEWCELNDADHAKIVAGGLFRTPNPGDELKEPPTYGYTTILSYVTECDHSHGSFRLSRQGQHAKIKCLLDDPTTRSRFIAKVMEDGDKKGAKNIRVPELTKWTNETLFMVGAPYATITQGVCERTVTLWLHKFGFRLTDYQKGTYKDGAMDDDVLDDVFDRFLPTYKKSLADGALQPADFDGVDDRDETGWSETAYERAKTRAEEARGPGAKPYVFFSHDEACICSGDSERFAWVKEGTSRLKPKGNSNTTIMIAYAVGVVGSRALEMTDEEYAYAKEAGYDGPKTSMVFFEVQRTGEDDPAAMEAAIAGETPQLDPEDDDSSLDVRRRLTDKVNRLKAAELKKFLASKNVKVKSNAKKDELKRALVALIDQDDVAKVEFLDDDGVSARKYDYDFWKGYFTNVEVMAQARGMVKLFKWKWGDRFIAIFIYDNAPSHNKRPDDSFSVAKMAKKDGFKGPLRKNTTWEGKTQELTMADPTGGDRRINKGLTRIGFERGHWDEHGKAQEYDENTDTSTLKTVTREQMIETLKKDPDFAAPEKSILEEFFEDEGNKGVAVYLRNPKFWCNFAWVENYWNDCKRATKQRCDNTLPSLKKNFPDRLRHEVPPERLAKYQRKCEEHMDVMRQIGRHGDFSKYDALVKQQSTHRQAHLVRLGVESEEAVRSRENWGAVHHARRVVPAPAPGPDSPGFAELGMD